MPTSGDNANCAEWLLSITTKVYNLAKNLDHRSEQ